MTSLSMFFFQTFKLDCYFRQSWVDDRLTFNATGITTLRMNWQFLNILWKPDSFFVNGQKSKLHKISVSVLCRIVLKYTFIIFQIKLLFYLPSVFAKIFCLGAKSFCFHLSGRTNQLFTKAYGKQIRYIFGEYPDEILFFNLLYTFIFNYKL